jgi:hypothetical protein
VFRVKMMSVNFPCPKKLSDDSDEGHEVLADSNSCAAYGGFRRVGILGPGRLGALRCRRLRNTAH